MSYLIVYDIQRMDNRMRLRVNRCLHKIGAVRLQQSVWELGSLVELRGLAASINSSGGKAFILKKKIVHG